MRWRQYTKLTFLVVFLPLLTQAQTVEDDFEGNGTITSWFGDACSLNKNFSNPFQVGINTSLKVLEYHDTGGQFANIRFDVPNNFVLSTSYTFTLKVYVPSSGLSGSQVNKISLKLQDGSLAAPWSTQSEIIKPILLNTWQTVTFDFKNDTYINLDNGSAPPTERSDFNRIVIQLNGENNTDHVLAYLDDFSYDGTIATAPESSGDPVFDKLVWSDEFDGSGPINSTKWFHQTQLPGGGSWYNGEVQHYTNQQANASLAGGVLNLTAKKENYSDQGFTKNYTSARLNSKFAFTYGRIEVRAKLPSGIGTWPAIWLLGKNINEDGAYFDNQGFGTTPWPQCGEIDVMEHWGDNQNFVQSATHTPSSSGGTINKGGQTISTASSTFHTYALDWFSDKLVFSVDDVVHYTYKPSVRNSSTWPFDNDFYILLNLAILPNISTGFVQGTMAVDYVRVYQEQTEEEEEIEEEVVEEEEEENEEVITAIYTAEKNAISFYPNPFDDHLIISLEGHPQQAVHVKIYTFSGMLARSFIKSAHTSQLLIEGLKDLPSGIYLITLEVDQARHRFKVIRR
ncbi:MAG: family 16 glycosylhydrolase [Cyclobacteriaceae bacterium]